MMNKCTGKKFDGSQCPKAGTCKAFNMGDQSIVMQAPFTINENGQFQCAYYALMTEQNLGNQDFGDSQMLNS